MTNQPTDNWPPANQPTENWLTDDWPTNWLIDDWPTTWQLTDFQLANQLTTDWWLTDDWLMTDQPTDWLTTDRPPDNWLTFSWPTNWLAHGWPTNWQLTDWWLTTELTGWWLNDLIDWQLTDWLTERPTDRQVTKETSQRTNCQSIEGANLFLILVIICDSKYWSNMNDPLLMTAVTCSLCNSWQCRKTVKSTLIGLILHCSNIWYNAFFAVDLTI